jgi:TonB family protein
MCKNIIRAFTLVVLLAATTTSQTKVGPDTVIIYTRCPPEFIPQVVVESILLSDAIAVDSLPRPTNGLEGIQQSVKYPELARMAKVQGKMLIEAIVDIAGKPTQVRVIKGDSPIFDETSLMAIRGATFAPARYHDNPVQAKIIIPISFVLKPKLRSTAQSGPLRLSEVSLSHGPGMLAGPEYSVSLKKDGSAEYLGKAHVALLGRYKGTIAQYDFGRLEALIQSLCILDCSPDRHQIVLDVSYDVIYVCRDDKLERVDTGDDQDERIWGVARVVDYLASFVKWEKISDLPTDKK